MNVMEAALSGVLILEPKLFDDVPSEHERTITWDDPDLAIDWQLQGAPVLSAKDSVGERLRDAEVVE